MARPTLIRLVVRARLWKRSMPPPARTRRWLRAHGGGVQSPARIEVDGDPGSGNGCDHSTGAGSDDAARQLVGQGDRGGGGGADPASFGQEGLRCQGGDLVADRGLGVEVEVLQR